MQYQWRVTFYEAGEEPYSELMSRFSSAWILSLPYPHLDGLNWHRLQRQELVDRLNNGDNQICVSWVNDLTRTVLERL